MSRIEKFCTVAGQCFNVASQYIEAYGSYLPIVGSGVQLAAAVKSKKLDYGMLIKETKIAIDLVKLFKKSLKLLEKIQDESKTTICVVNKSKDFLKEFETLLEWYSPDTFNELQKSISGDWYRIQLQYYMQYMQMFMTNIQLTALEIKMKRAEILKINDKNARKEKLRELMEEYTCEEEDDVKEE